jgi:hypothetical protein
VRNCHRLLFVALSALLVGCAASTILKGPIAGNSDAGLPSIGRAPMTASPCDLTYYYYLRGSCATGNVTASGATFSLQPYRRLTLSLQLGKNSILNGYVPFVVADATGKGDITPYQGGKPFPLYNSHGALCYVPGKQGQQQCVGTAFMYFVIQDRSYGTDVSFSHTPKIRITNAANYPGARCELDELEQMGGSASAWILEPWYAAPKKHSLIFAPHNVSAGGLVHWPYFFTVACR